MKPLALFVEDQFRVEHDHLQERSNVEPIVVGEAGQ
jgi:hypothetical protein